ncbi:MAG: DHH family phosphoesterase [Patescibacteria group bacterium]
MLDQKSLSEAKKLIEEAHRILIVPHANVDPDGLSSALATYLVLTAAGKECTVLCPDTLPESLEFLPGYEKLENELSAPQSFVITLDCSRGVELDKLRYSVEEKKVNIIVTPKKGTFQKSDVTLQEGAFPYDLTIIVDTAELKLLGSLFEGHPEFFRNVPILNIDHHISNTRFGKVQVIDPASASATEVLYRLFISDPEWKKAITPDIATLLLTGLITDTRSFQNPNTTPESLEVAAALLDHGARQQEIIRYIYKTKPLSTLKIWGRALHNIQVNAKERIVWSAIGKEDLAEMHAESKETHGIIDELLTTIPEAEVYILFTEVEEGGFKASLRSTASTDSAQATAIDVSALSGKLFGGGGHARAAGFRVKDYDNFQLQILECIQKIIGEMQKQRAQKTGTDVVKELGKNGKKDETGGVDVLREITKRKQ